MASRSGNGALPYPKWVSKSGQDLLGQSLSAFDPFLHDQDPTRTSKLAIGSTRAAAITSIFDLDQGERTRPRAKNTRLDSEVSDGCTRGKQKGARWQQPGADLSYAKLYGANLIHANLSGAKLQHTQLSGASLTGASVTPEQLGEAGSLRDTIMPDGSKHA